MKKFSLFITFLILILFLTGCNLPGSSDPEVDLVATQVAILLTESATETQPAGVEDEPTPTVTLQPSPTETAVIEAPTATQTATATLTATPEPDQDDPAQQLGSPAWTYDFNGETSPWDFESPQANYETANGFLNMTAKANANWHSWYVSSPKLENAYVETTIEFSDCSGFDRFGFAVRASSDGQQFYFLSVTCDSRMGFFRMAPGVDIHPIKAYENVPLLSDLTETPHRVGIWMEGSTFTFYIDGEEVGTASDSTLADEGYTGYLIAFSNTPGFTVQVDELRYWNLP